MSDLYSSYFRPFVRSAFEMRSPVMDGVPLLWAHTTDEYDPQSGIARVVHMTLGVVAIYVLSGWMTPSPHVEEVWRQRDFRTAQGKESWTMPAGEHL